MNADPKGNLLDTGVALIAVDDPAKLNPEIQKAIVAGPNFLSVVAYWEVMLKSVKGKLDAGDPRAWWFDTLDQLAATPLPLRPEHVAAIHGLLPIHNDPFDRALIAQATVECLTLVTADSAIALYESALLRVIS